MNLIVPYSINIFPTCRKLFHTINTYEISQLKGLFQYRSFGEFLVRMEATIDKHFEANKIDCNINYWERTAEKIELFQTKEDLFWGKALFTDLNKKVHEKFELFEKKKYECCFMDFESRFSMGLCINLDPFKALAWQVYLNALIVEADTMQLAMEWVEKIENRIKLCDFLDQNASRTEKEGMARCLEITTSLYADAKNYFNSYSAIVFSDPNKKIIYFKDVETAEVPKARRVFDKLKKDKQGKFELISKIANSILIVNDACELLVPTPEHSLKRDIVPFYHYAYIESGKSHDELDEVFENLKIIQKHWNSLKNEQESFFNYGIKELGKLIESNDSGFMMYTLDTTHGPPKTRSIRTYPSEVPKKETDYKDFFASCRAKSESNSKLEKKFPEKPIENKPLKEKKVKEKKKPKKKQCKDLVVRKPSLEDKPSKITVSKVVDAVKQTSNFVQTACKVFTSKDTYTLNQEVLRTVQKPSKLVIPKPISNKPSFPGNPFPYVKQQRVTRWETDFYADLQKEDFPDYDAAYLQQEQMWLKLIHNPHPFIDNFLHLGFEHSFFCEDRQEYHPSINILTEINFMDQIYRGVIQYTFDRDKKLVYHKCFKYKFDNDEFMQSRLKAFDYPTLSKDCTETQYGQTIVEIDDQGNVFLNDAYRKMTVKLLKC